MTPPSQDNNSLSYHPEHKSNLRGCIPFYALIMLVIIVMLGVFIQVDVPERSLDQGEGHVYYQPDPAVLANIRSLSPLPIELPRFADPAQQTSYEIILNHSREPKLAPAPSIKPFDKPAYSAVLKKDELLPPISSPVHKP